MASLSNSPLGPRTSSSLGPSEQEPPLKRGRVQKICIEQLTKDVLNIIRACLPGAPKNQALRLTCKALLLDPSVNREVLDERIGSGENWLSLGGLEVLQPEFSSTKCSSLILGGKDLSSVEKVTRLIERFPNLSRIHMKNCKITPESFFQLCTLPLKYLDFSVRENGLELLSSPFYLKGSLQDGCKPPYTRDIDCGFEQFKGFYLSSLQRLKLDYLNIAGALLINSDLMLLNEVVSLRYLDLSLTGVSDAGIEKLCNLRIEKLCLSRCYLITDQSLLCLPKSHLKHLVLSNCKITNQGLSYLKGTQIEHLALANCSQITPKGFLSLKDLPLKHLDVGWCEIGDNGLGHLRDCPFESLTLSCSRISDHGLLYLKGKALRHLNISSNHRITPAGLSVLAGAPIEYLDIRWCSQLAIPAFHRELEKMFPSLKTLLVDTMVSV